MIVRLDSLDDPRLDVYARLTEVQLRNKLEPEKGIFIAESDKVVRRALAGGMRVQSLLMEEKWLEPLADLVMEVERRFPGTPVFVAPRGELAKLTGYELTRGTLGAFARPPLRSVSEVLRDAHLVAVLENITNHTNVGAIFRSAAAMGVDAVLVTPACYDPLYRRAVRVSMGTVFQVPWTRIGTDGADNEDDAGGVREGREGHGGRGAGDGHDWAASGVPLLRSLGFATAAMALSDDSVSLNDPCLKKHDKLALVFGTEGDGLAHSTIARCDYTVRIPMAYGVDSLNVAAASAVAFWEFKRREL